MIGTYLLKIVKHLDSINKISTILIITIIKKLEITDSNKIIIMINIHTLVFKSNKRTTIKFHLVIINIIVNSFLKKRNKHLVTN